jgi:hypothetical protein
MVHDDAWSIGPAPRQTSTSGYLISKTIEIEIVVIFVIIVVHPRAPAIVLVVLSFYLVVPAFPQPAIQPGLAGFHLQGGGRVGGDGWRGNVDGWMDEGDDANKARGVDDDGARWRVKMAVDPVRFSSLAGRRGDGGDGTKKGETHVAPPPGPAVWPAPLQARPTGPAWR